MGVIAHSSPPQMSLLSPTMTSRDLVKSDKKLMSNLQLEVDFVADALLDCELGGNLTFQARQLCIIILVLRKCLEVAHDHGG
jgi:hypothetical protein